MAKAVFIPLALAATVAGADEGPRLFFSKDDLPALRKRAAQPDHAAAWQNVLSRADAYCNPENGQYTDPSNVYKRSAKSEYVSQHRYDAVLASTAWAGC